MKCSLPRQELVAALNKVKSAALSRGPLPVLANVCLAAAGKKLTLTCTDRDITIRTKVDADVEADGETTVNAALFYNLVHSFEGLQPVELHALKTELKVSCGRASVEGASAEGALGGSKYRLGSIPTDEFPPMPKLKDPVELEVPQFILRGLLAETAFAMATGGDRPQIIGARLQCGAGKISVGANNRSQIALSEVPAEDKKAKADFTIPRKAVTELLRLLDDTDPDNTEGDEEQKKKPALLKIVVAANVAQFHLGNDVITTVLPEGDYPGLRVIADNVTKNGAEDIPIGRVDLLRAVRRVALISDECMLELDGQILTIRSRDGKDIPGEAVESLLIPKSKKVSIALDAGFLTGALEAISDDQVHLFVSGPLKPAMLKVDSKDWLCIIAATVKAQDKSASTPAPVTKDKAPEGAKPEPAAKAA